VFKRPFTRTYTHSSAAAAAAATGCGPFRSSNFEHFDYIFLKLVFASLKDKAGHGTAWSSSSEGHTAEPAGGRSRKFEEQSLFWFKTAEHGRGGE